MSSKWEIWRSVDCTETTVIPAEHPQHSFLTHDVDGVKMLLVHEFTVDGEPEEAFAYANKYLWGQDNESSQDNGCTSGQE